MKKLRITALVLSFVLVLSLAGCGGGGGDSSSSAPAPDESTPAATETAADATEFVIWSFVDNHLKFFGEMADLWNEQNPDEQIVLKPEMIGWDDLHNKLYANIQAGSGIPDIVDVEISRYSQFMNDIQFVEMDEYVKPYLDDIVTARLAIYGRDGHSYGIPTHVGATVAFYNTEILEANGIDYTTLKTWDNYKEAGQKLYADTGGATVMGVAEVKGLFAHYQLMTSQGSDFSMEDGTPNVNSPEMVKAATMVQDMINSNVMRTIPGGYPDSEEAFGFIADGGVASFVMPLWYMDRFFAHMPDAAGKFALAPAPVFEEGQPRSVGGGGTASVVTNACANTDLASRFVTFAKLTYEGGVKIWEMGMDPVVLSVWADDAVINDPDLQVNTFFVNKPVDVFNEISDEIGVIKGTVYSWPTINDYFSNTGLSRLYENMEDPQTVLDEAQETIMNELGG